jgi:hypothetical protein
MDQELVAALLSTLSMLCEVGGWRKVGLWPALPVGHERLPLQLICAGFVRRPEQARCRIEGEAALLRSVNADLAAVLRRLQAPR